MLRADYSPRFCKDYKRLSRKRYDMKLLDEVIALVLTDDDESKRTLVNRHNMHRLKGNFSGAYECHVANIGDWLLVWQTGNGIAFFARTGKHDEIFG
ncbi:type II toxin-antitoxin system YafQ family toxin [Bifidobacterium panos]|uniref:Addiction module toxin, RelE/StbE family n=1 Tax=Bifidobacterium panos TaxID=2675321 RepID=A0ABX1T039_9BIFI|nr:type II toxin-antitoxin system YafQ family toxin [Bifidobacterium sp. DSM 109963]NMN02503.1 addiction module toxin, RelE/StbE family [Bifidobacterium sp. DSM 109963]